MRTVAQNLLQFLTKEFIEGMRIDEVHKLSNVPLIGAMGPEGLVQCHKGYLYLHFFLTNNGQNVLTRNKYRRALLDL